MATTDRDSDHIRHFLEKYNPPSPYSVRVQVMLASSLRRMEIVNWLEDHGYDPMGASDMIGDAVAWGTEHYWVPVDQVRDGWWASETGEVRYYPSRFDIVKTWTRRNCPQCGKPVHNERLHVPLTYKPEAETCEEHERILKEKMEQRSQ